jgi:hypothetical protein
MAANPHGYAKLDTPGKAAKVRTATGEPTPKTGQNTVATQRRTTTLEHIAANYHQLVSPLNGPSGIRGDGQSDPAMPPTYTPTVREFERLMRLMRNQAKQQAHSGESLGTLRWHILAWHVNADRSPHQQPVVVTTNTGKKRQLRRRDGRPELRVTHRNPPRRHPQARADKARLGIEWLAQNWGLRTEPELYVDKP